jgi:hypothetical protein
MITSPIMAAQLTTETCSLRFQKKEKLISIKNLYAIVMKKAIVFMRRNKVLARLLLSSCMVKEREDKA